MSRIEVVAGIVVKGAPGQMKQVLLAKRNAKQHQGGLWEFPGGKVDANEDHQTALKRELKEELDILVQHCTLYQVVQFDYADKQVTLNFFLVSDYTGEEKGVEGQLIRWVDIERLSDYNFPEANQVVVERLINEKLSC